MFRMKSGRSWWRRLPLVALVGVLVVAAFPAAAQDTRTPVIGWADVTPTDHLRQQSDWLVDVGKAQPEDVYGPFLGKPYQEGDTEKFFALDFDQSKPQRTLRAELRLVTEHAYWWFEDGTDVDQGKIESEARQFESQIYPLNRLLFGDPWTPGIDGDPRIFILHQKSIGGYAVGVFSPKDECPRRLCPNSNQREMIYVGLDNGEIDSPRQLTVIAHEFQHLIQYNNDGNEERWLDEGLAQLAEHLNGFNPRYIANSNLRDFLRNTNFQLNSWPYRLDVDPAVNYAVGYIFCVYLYQRFGTSFIQYLARSPYKGLASIEEALRAQKTGVTLDDVFADWTVTNYVNSPYVGDGRYYYQSLKLPQRADTVDLSPRDPRSAELNEYGADYLQLDGAGNYTLNFEGDTTVRLTDVLPTSGSWMWWSYNEERGIARLERDFDLTNAQEPKLTFKAWWDLRDQSAWVDILASTDGGKDWDLLKTNSTSNCRLLGNVPCYRGRSKDWSPQTVDLSDYAGQKIRLRIEYVTDRPPEGEGMYIDDFALSAIGYKDDVETANGGWKTQGFVRVQSDLPQHWAVNVITRNTPPRVLPVNLGADNKGKLKFTAPNDGAVIVVGAMAPFIEATSNYTITVDKN